MQIVKAETTKLTPNWTAEEFSFFL